MAFIMRGGRTMFSTCNPTRHAMLPTHTHTIAGPCMLKTMPKKFERGNKMRLGTARLTDKEECEAVYLHIMLLLSLLSF